MKDARSEGERREGTTCGKGLQTNHSREKHFFKLSKSRDFKSKCLKQWKKKGETIKGKKINIGRQEWRKK